MNLKIKKIKSCLFPFKKYYLMRDEELENEATKYHIGGYADGNHGIIDRQIIIDGLIKMHKASDSRIAIIISIVSLIISICLIGFSYYGVYKNEKKSSVTISQELLDKKINELNKKIALVEIRTLVPGCVNLVNNTFPSPQSPDEVLELTNKCIHQYASLSETKKAEENSNFNLWTCPNGIITPGGCNGGDELIQFKQQKDYPKNLKNFFKPVDVNFLMNIK